MNSLRKLPLDLIVPALAAAAVFAVAPVMAATRQAVDLELVIATDVSPSIDQVEAKLQREGIAEAFLNPQVIQAIKAGSLGRIAVAYVDFSSRPYNKIVLNWQVISDEKSAAAFANALRNAPPTFGRHTSLSEAIELGALLFEANDVDGTRKVIDISGDGPNNWGPEITTVRDQTLAQNVIINGLPITGQGSFPGIENYFANCVVGGKGAFLIVAEGFQDFARAIRNKLILEIADASQGMPLVRVADRGPIPVQAGPRAGRPLTREECETRFGFGGFGGFTFPPQPPR